MRKEIANDHLKEERKLKKEKEWKTEKRKKERKVVSGI